MNNDNRIGETLHDKQIREIREKDVKIFKKEFLPIKEPLKKKAVDKNIIALDIEEVFYYNDVKSAVEWLKEKVINNYPLTKGKVLRLIDEAFEDVTKK